MTENLHCSFADEMQIVKLSLYELMFNVWTIILFIIQEYLSFSLFSKFASLINSYVQCPLVYNFNCFSWPKACFKMSKEVLAFSSWQRK